MAPDKTLLERDKTDRSLQSERANTDQALVEKLAVVDDDADEVIERARTQADAVLDKARDKADDQLESATDAPPVTAEIAKDRALEDSAIDAERSAADARVRRGRERQAEALAALLPLEREKTDQHLLTERVRSDDELALRDDFLGMVTHDLRDLLNSIALNATALAAQASESPEGRRTVEGVTRIQRYVARMNRLIGDLVDVVSIDAGRLAVYTAPGDANALLTEVVDAFAHAATEKGIRLNAEVSSSPLPAAFDSDRILQVLGDLVSNAVKFTPRDGVVDVRGERNGADIHLSVRDTGIGVSSDKQTAIFERFWQVGKNDQRGLGLGLYISKCIVDAHGGRIWVDSEPGAGSTFHVTIPRQARCAG
jgi:signal transduction histidine kinase